MTPEQSAQLLRDAQALRLASQAVQEAAANSSLDDKLQTLVRSYTGFGFDRARLVLRGAAGEALVAIEAGECGSLSSRDDPALWISTLPRLERFRSGGLYVLVGDDIGAAAELLEPAGETPPTEVVLARFDAPGCRLRGTLTLTGHERQGRELTEGELNAIALLSLVTGELLERRDISDLAAGRAARVQRLQEVGSRLARSLDEREIVRELARQVTRMLRCDGIVLSQTGQSANTMVTALRLVRGIERPRAPLPKGAGPIGEVVRTGRPVRLGDYDPARIALAASDDVVGDGGPASSVLAVPLMIGLNLIGVLAIYSAERRAYSEEDEELLAALASQAATAIANARLYAESQAERRQIEALAEVARAVGESLRLVEVMRLILRHATALLRTEGACIALQQNDSELEVVAGTDSAESLIGTRLPIRASLAGRAMLEGSYVIVNDAAANADVYQEVRRAAEIERTVIVPLVTARGAIGVLTVINRETDFTESDARVLLRLADQVAVAIVNARLFEDLAKATREWTIAFDAIPGGMVLLDDDGSITRCNARAVQLADAESAEALLGRPFREAILGERAGRPGGVHMVAIRERIVARATHRVESRGRLYEVVAAPHPNGGAVVTFDDVTSHHALAERHRLVLETASEAIVMIDLQERIAFANPAAVELFGRTTGLIGTPLGDLVLPSLLDDVRGRQARAIAGQAQRYEAIIVRPDGDQRIVSISMAPLREVGDTTGVVVSLSDITDARRARDAVVASEGRYRNLFETASDSIYTVDVRGAFTSVNQATCRISGYDREELLGRSVGPLLHPDEADIVREHFKAALAGESRRYECHFITRQGERRLISVTNTPIRQRNTVVGVLGVARDITEERRHAEALQRSEARYTRLVESASDAIFTVDRDGRFTSVNRALERSIGLPREALNGRMFTEVVDPRDREAAWETFLRTLYGERSRMEFRWTTLGGECRHASIVTAPIEEGGQITGGLGVVRDITEEKRLVEQALQQEKLAAIGQLVSGVAHELNNPLAAIMAFSQLLLASPPTQADQQQRALDTIHAEARRAAKIVTNLLTFARQHQPERRATDLNQVLLDTAELRRYALRVQQIELSVSLDPDLPITWADQFQLQQVVLNLVSNAEQSFPPDWSGAKRISIRSEKEEETLRIRIADTGEGIPPGAIDRIFNPFYTTKVVGQGTGLGLSIADGIVREHGGVIRVESTPGAGSEFIIELPYIAPLEQPEDVGPLTERTSEARPRRILIVDDEPAIRQALVQFLGSAGHTVDSVGSGTEALAAVSDCMYDAILLDLRMPDMSGDAVYEQIRASNPEQASRIVFVTGDVQSETARAFISATGRPSLSKPFMLDEVAAALFDTGPA